GNSLHAKPSSAAYAYTEISVPKEGTYLFKVMGDDQLCLWLDTQTEKGWKRSIAAWISAVSPVTRSALKKRVHLSKGRHRLLFRLNQYRGRWQGSVKIRTSDDKVSEIIGIANDSL
ncbi:hypothetical protein ACFL6F_04030, partial [Planctomycetota bacterium]